MVRAKYSFLAFDLKRCCLEDAFNFRKEAMLRLGPIAKTSKEEADWEMFYLSYSSREQLLDSSAEFIRYAPHLAEMGRLLQKTRPQ